MQLLRPNSWHTPAVQTHSVCSRRSFEEGPKLDDTVGSRSVRALPRMKTYSDSAPHGRHAGPTVTTSTDSISDVTATKKKAISRHRRDSVEL